jgi:hypothetical protein
VAGVAGSVDADGFPCWATGDCAGSVTAVVKAAMATNRIGAEKRMRVRRVGAKEVMALNEVSSDKLIADRVIAKIRVQDMPVSVTVRVASDSK